MPLNNTMGENRKSSVFLMVLSGIITLLALSVFGAISPNVTAVAAIAGFAILLVRFIWLVWRELE